MFLQAGSSGSPGFGAEFWFNISERYVTVDLTVFSENAVCR